MTLDLPRTRSRMQELAHHLDLPVEMAAWDLHARQRGEPLWRTLGGSGLLAI